ncbi:DUF4153 domain-containing protein [Qipengyuania vulgaris]|nr:DUF4153 domain-containing protein [Qipengyuania vulgaris]
MTDTDTTRDTDWSLRPWMLALLLGVAGLLIHYASDWQYDNVPPWRAALTGFLFFGPLAFAFTLVRERWRGPLAFALLVGAVMAGIAWRVARAEDHYADEGYWLAAGIVSIALALPLFQARFHRLRWRTSYDDTHFHVWTDAISAGGALAFTGLSFLLANLLAELFAAIEIEFLRELLREEWFNWTFAGVTFGAALGVLRNQLKVIGTLQSVGMLVLSLIAVPFAGALAIFILAVLVSGLDVLWGATRSPTPLLLSCAAASFVLVNSVVRNGDAEASGSRVLRWAALVLALGILPLSIMAAISTGTRIAEYGLSPERIWGLIAIMVAVAYGVAYFVAPIRGRMTQWMERVRRANLHLAAGTCVLAFILALPILDFGVISARDQLARLQAGEVSAEDFDFAALRWDFGDAGREALAKLAKSGNAQVAKLAQEAQAQTERSWPPDGLDGRGELTDRFAVYPVGTALPAGLKDAIAEVHVCRGEVVCRVYLQADDETVAVLGDGCTAPQVTEGEAVEPGRDCAIDIEPFGFRDGGWKILTGDPPAKPMSKEEERVSLLRERRAIESGAVTIAPSREREIFVGGEPTGRKFE